MLHEHHPLAGRKIAAPPLAIRVAADGSRFSLRIDPAHAADAAAAFGCPLPGRIGGVAASDGRTAVCLGPDEWHLFAALEDRDGIEARFAELYGKVPHSLVDVSHREVGIEIEGEAAVRVLQSAVAFDIEAMPAGTGCRSIFDKAQIVLVRETGERFRIEVWRSFAGHVWGILQAASREIVLGI